MILLVDTHVFLWSVLQTEKLPDNVFKILKSPDTEVFVSAVTFWEISIKARLGKIELVNLTTDDLIPAATEMGFLPTALSPEESVSQHKLLENTHFDPFDRMLIWQAICRNIILVSGDSEFKRFEKHGLKLLWKNSTTPG